MAVAAMKVPTIFTAVDRFSHVVSNMTRNTALFTKTAEAAALRTSTRLNALGTSMLTYGAGMGIGIALAVNESMKFEKSISNISTLTKNTPEQMKAIGDSILNTSTKIPIAISDLTEGMYDVVSAGIEGTSHQLEVLNRSGRLAVAGLGTTKEAVNITTSALNAFGKEAGTAYQVTNLLMKSVKYGKTTVSGISESFGSFAAIMKNSGVTLQEYLASTTALTTAGMSMSRAQTQVSSATIALIKPNGEMLKVYQKLGVKDVPAFIKANGGLVKTLELVGKTSEGMGLMLSKVFGRKEGLSAYLSLIGALSPKFKEIMTDMASGSDMVNEAFAKQQKTFSAQFQIMKNKTIALAIAIGNELMPRISGFFNSISPMVSGLIDWIKRNEWLATTILNVTVGLLALGAVMKIGAVLFYGLSKGIAIVTAVLKVHRLVLLASAISNASYASSLVLLATATWAAYWPILAVVGVLGLLAYAFASSGNSVDEMVSKKVVALDKGNEAWRNSTKVMESELAKQKKLTEVPKVPVTKEQVKMQEILAKEEKRQAFVNSTKVGRDMAGKSIVPKINDSVAKTLYENRQMEAVVGKEKATVLRNQGFTFEEFKKVYPNVAGYSEREATDKKGEITIILKGNTESVSSVIGTGDFIFSGIPAKTSSTKTPSKR